MADVLVSPSLVESLKMAQVHANDLAEALGDLRDRCAREGIPFAVVGALAMYQHGYLRFSEDIDIVTTPDGLARIHERLVGRGLVPRAPGLQKKLRDTVHKVNIDVIVSGEHAGARESPVVYPPPDSAQYGIEHDGVRYATLPALMCFKLTAGRWGHRPKDFADAIELIKANHLDESWAIQLMEPLREEFKKLVQAARDERDVE